MKSKLYVATLLFGLSLGLNARTPDTHKCFSIAILPGQAVDGDIPVEMCIESITVDMDNSQLSVASDITPQFFSKLSVHSFMRNEEGRVRFYATKEIFRDWKSDCSEGQTVSVVISGQSDANGQVQLNNELRLMTDEKTTSDTCRVQPTTTTYRYVLR